MSFDPKQPFNNLPLLPPPGDLETKSVLKKCVAANRALAELKGAGDLIPNQAVLINAIPLQEAKLSSEIENIVTTQDALFQAALDESRVTDPTKELVELVFAQPYSKIQFLVDAGIAERKTASEYLQELEKLGILKGEKRGREVLYRHPALLKVLTA